jgi:diguanylate cyclase (GGDEF)-like protein
VSKDQEQPQFLSDSELLNRLKNCTSLPSPPGIALQVIELAQDPDVNIAKVADVVSMDPALAAKILRVANSPLYALQRKTENLRQAIMLLGLNGTLTLALSFSLVSSLGAGSKEGLDYNYFWKRSLAAATCSRRLAAALKLGSEDMFLASLLQDIGMLVCAKVLPDIYKGIGPDQSDHQHVQSVELEKIGADHAAVGAWMLQQWGLPQRLQHAVSGSHDPAVVTADDAEFIPFIRCVALSGQLVDISHSAEPLEAYHHVVQKAGEWLGMDREALQSILEEMDNDLREAGKLFDMELGDFNLADGLLDQAKETLMVLNLQTIQHVSDLKDTQNKLESTTRELEEKSRRDSLTGLYNRAHLDEVTGKEFQLAKTNTWPMTVIFVDLDHFKRVNDTYGHQVGDDVLKTASALLQENTRDGDIVARYGGEEFIIILPGGGVTSARAVTRRFLEAFRNTPHRMSPTNTEVVTASIGVAVHGEQMNFESCDELIRAADSAVYAAKRQSRNCVVEYDGRMEVTDRPDTVAAAEK